MGSGGDMANASRLNNQALRLASSGRAEEALEALRRASDLAPGSGFILANYCRALRSGFGPKRALAAIERALASLALGVEGIDEGRAEVLELRGLCLQDIGLLQEAGREYRAALAQDPGLGSAWNNLGTVLFLSGDYAGARESFERAISLDHGLTDAYFNLADACRELGDDQAAAKADAEYRKRQN